MATHCGTTSSRNRSLVSNAVLKMCKRLQDKYQGNTHMLRNFNLGGQEENGSLAFFWYQDDSDILCHPANNREHGPERNRQTTEVYYVSEREQ